METRYDTQHNEGNSATHCALKKRRVIQDVSNGNVKYGIAAANLSRVPQCPNQCLSKVTVFDEHGNVMGHVSTYVDKLRSVKPTDHCRLGCRDVMSSATSTVIPQTTNSQDISRRRVHGLKIKAPEEDDLSSYGVSSNATRCSEGSYTDTSEILPATEFNVRRATDTHRTHDRKAAQSRVIPNIDEIFTCLGASSGVKPPLGPSRLRRGVLTGSKSLNCLQAIPTGCPFSGGGSRRFARDLQPIAFTAAASTASKSKAEVDVVEVSTKRQQGGERIARIDTCAEPVSAPQVPTVTPENKKSPVTVPLTKENSRIFRDLFPDVTASINENTSMTPQPQPQPTPHLSMKRSASMSDLDTPNLTDDCTAKMSARKRVKACSGTQPKLNAPSASFQLLTRFNSLKDSWLASSRKMASAKSVDWNALRRTVFVATPPTPPYSSSPDDSRTASISHPTPSPSHAHTPSSSPSSLPSPSSKPSSGSKSFSLRTFALQQLSAICAEQDRLRALFVSDVSRALGYRIRGAADRINCLYGTHLLDRSDRSPSVQQIVLNYQKLSMQQLERQEHALRWAIAVDGMSDPRSVPPVACGKQYVPRPKLSFRHSDIFRTALLFESTACTMIAEAEAGAMEG